MTTESKSPLQTFFSQLDVDTRRELVTALAEGPEVGIRGLISKAEAAGLNVSSDEALRFIDTELADELGAIALDDSALDAVVGGIQRIRGGRPSVKGDRKASLTGDSNVHLTGDSPVY